MRIVVSLVVILAVGFTIISISQSLLGESESNINEIDDIVLEKKMIKKPNFAPEEISHLVEQCYQNNHGHANKELCYVLNSDTAISAGGANLPSYAQVSAGSSKTLYIEFQHPNVVIRD